MTVGQGTLSLPLVASGGAGPLTFSTRAIAWNQQAYDLDQQYGFTSTGDYLTNWGGAGEKWFKARDNTWFCVLPNGEVRRWTGLMSTTLLSPALIATLDTAYYADPSLLWNASVPSAPPATCTISG